MDAAQLQDALRKLRLVAEKADKLWGLSFAKYVIDGGRIGFSGAADGSDVTYGKIGPGEESIDAFVLTLRFFIQDNEPTSLRNVQGLFETLPIDPRRIEAVKDSRQTINAHLDAETGITFAGKRIARREIFETFLYGALAHANREKKQTHDAWMRHSAAAVVLASEFAGTLVEMLQAIRWFGNAAREAADILEQPQSPPAPSVGSSGK